MRVRVLRILYTEESLWYSSTRVSEGVQRVVDFTILPLRPTQVIEHQVSAPIEVVSGNTNTVANPIEDTPLSSDPDVEVVPASSKDTSGEIASVTGEPSKSKKSANESTKIAVKARASQYREDLKTPSSKVAKIGGMLLGARPSFTGLDCPHPGREHLAHVLIQEALEAKVALDAQIAELEAKVADLKAQLATIVEENKKVLVDALERGRTDGFSAGHVAKPKEARDFLKAPAFKMAVDIQSTHFLNEGFDKCISQVRHLHGFLDGFDQSQLDPPLDAMLQLYPKENVVEVAEHDEVEALMADIGNLPWLLRAQDLANFF
ncbi:hypothetical protein Salat_0064800 [Sesamum alatum]|uniref:Uncharacterized protein n=1 Tax=Sesamum alatum TaxID=300844 RepID=A0AAE1YVP0_9LAMI|nr:hypothetical protein Salat_0064800 [Sesamum alatum]